MSRSGRLPAVVAAGSNLGDRLGFLQRGLDLLAAHDLVYLDVVSAVYETEPVGGPDQPAYLNAVCLLETALTPIGLLGTLHVIEAACGRTRELRWGPRTLDLDLVSVGVVVSADPVLTLPHPRAHERAFVLVPWLDVDPAAVLLGRGPAAGLPAARDRAGVRRCDDLRLVLPASSGRL